MDRALDDDTLDRLREAMVAELRPSFAATGHEGRLADAAAEALPVLDATLAATQPGRTDADRHEALAMAALLGRRAVTLRLSPTATLALGATVVRLAQARGADLGAALEGQLVACAMEGFVAAESEHVRAEVDARAAAGVTALAFGERALAVPIPATIGADALETALDGVARRLLAADADTCIVIVLGEPDERDDGAFASALAGLGASALMVGARVAYVVASARLRTTLAAAVPDHVVVETLPDALAKVDITVSRVKKPLSTIKKFFGGGR